MFLLRARQRRRRNRRGGPGTRVRSARPTSRSPEPDPMLRPPTHRDHGRHLLFGDRSGAQDLDRVDRGVDDRALDADRAGSTVEDHVDRGSSQIPRSATTCAAVVGLTAPNRLADGAANGTPADRISSRAIGCAGTRSPTVSRPPATAAGSRSERGTINVSGPGQHVAASARAAGDAVGAHRSRSDRSARWTINGWSAGRPLTAKIRAIAAGSVASAARP